LLFFAGEPAVLELVKKAKDDRMFVCFSVIMEYEVFSGLNSEYRLQGIKLFNSRRCIEVSSKIARLAGDIRRQQRSNGRKLKTPDAIIIATSIEHPLGLVSRDHDMRFVREAFGVPLITI